MFHTRFKRSWLLLAMVLVISIAAACGSDPVSGESSGAALATSNPLAGQAGASDQGCQTYAVECAACHGATGVGDGVHGKHLMPAPSDLRRATLAKTDEQLYQRIWNGGAMPPFNSGMPAYKDLLSPDQIWQILVYVRALAGDKARICSAPDDAGVSGPGKPTSGTVAGHGGDGAQHDPTGAGGATAMSGAGGMSGASGSGATGGRSGASGASGSSSGAGGAAGAGAGAAGTTGQGGASGAGGASGSSGGATSQACLDWCGCLQAECSELSAYPFDSEAMCQARCESLGAQELSCWTDQCMEAGSGQEALREHHCEHGWGAHGLEEC
jgi:mono/diheme cytochrome c family protein